MSILKYQSLADGLRARIESLPRGSRLPSLRALKQRTGYSIQTINTAIGLLEQEGILLRKHGSGLYVSPKKGTRHIALCRSTFPSLNVLIKEQGLIQACARRGWNLTPHQFRFDRPDILDQEVRGDAVVIFSELLSFEYDITRVLLSSKIPLVALGPKNESSDIDCVTGDNFAAHSLILKKLVSLGHRRIAYLNTEPSCGEIDQKLADFKKLAGVFDLAASPVIDCHTRSGQNTEITTTRAMNAFLAAHPKRLPFTALVSCSSPGSVAAMRALYEHGWRIPRDCSVLCMHDDMIAPYIVPALTNLKWDYPSWGEHCADLIEKRLSGKLPPAPQTVQIVPEINWRESVARAPRQNRRSKPVRKKTAGR